MGIGQLFLAMSSVIHGYPDSQTCGMYSREVFATASAWSGCDLQRAGQKPLWPIEKLPTDAEVVRFFSSGRDRSFRYITFIKLSDGSSRIESGGLDWSSKSAAEWWPKRRRIINAQERAQLDSLLSASGTFDFPIGSWDGKEIYIHCQSLAMERVHSQVYSFSSVSIGCNRPEKLVKVVDLAAKLVNRPSLLAGWWRASSH
jgi:hypothetical protein